jgi:hypothetical protein
MAHHASGVITADGFDTTEKGGNHTLAGDFSDEASSTATAALSGD